MTSQYRCFVCDSDKDLTNLIGTVHACGQHMNPPDSEFPMMAALTRAVNGDTP